MPRTTFGKSPRRPPYKGVTTESLYVPMRDGARIAVDVMRPASAPADLKLPAILIIARYWRSFALRGFAPPNRAPIGPRQPLPDFLVTHGYAVVAMDTRGSGASTGSTPYDGRFLVPGEVAELRFGLLPASCLVRRGHRLRVAIAGHDKDTFARIPDAGGPIIAVQRNRRHPSRIELPIVRS